MRAWKPAARLAGCAASDPFTRCRANRRIFLVSSTHVSAPSPTTPTEPCSRHRIRPCRPGRRSWSTRMPPRAPIEAGLTTTSSKSSGGKGTVGANWSVCGGVAAVAAVAPGCLAGTLMVSVARGRGKMMARRLSAFLVLEEEGGAEPEVKCGAYYAHRLIDGHTEPRTRRDGRHRHRRRQKTQT